MKLEEFESALVLAKPQLEAWGAHIAETIKDIANSHNIKLHILSHRVKEIDSAIGKLSRKNYSDPLNDMTDLVGVRAVCLLSHDVESLCLALESYSNFDIQKSRDTSKEYEQVPEKFGYQSQHYEIRAKVDTEIDGTQINSNTCCELQLRTLMQHAYAEVVHDSIYKSSWAAPSRAMRFISSSAALIETADHLFCETMTLLESETKNRGELLEQLTTIYEQTTQNKKFKDQKFNMMVLEELSPIVDESTVIQGLPVFLADRKFIAERIIDRIDSDAFWSQPISLLAYYLANVAPTKLKEYWPFSESDEALEKVYSDLGKSYHQ